MRRMMGVCACLLAASEAGAQTVSPDIAAAAVHHKLVRVINDHGEQFEGRLLRLDNQVFMVETTRGNLPFSFEGISTIERKGDSLRNGLIVGLVIGTVGGVLATSGHNGCGNIPTQYAAYCDTRSKASIIANSVATWTVVSVGIDALTRGWTRIYPPHGARNAS